MVRPALSNDETTCFQHRSVVFDQFEDRAEDLRDQVPRDSRRELMPMSP